MPILERKGVNERDRLMLELELVQVRQPLRKILSYSEGQYSLLDIRTPAFLTAWQQVELQNLAMHESMHARSKSVALTTYRNIIMALPDSYTPKPGSIPAYFDAILQAEAPQRFSIKFLEGLEFKNTNDRLLVGVLKDLGFLDTDAVPTKRYYEFLDRSQSRKVLATAIRDAYADCLHLTRTRTSFRQRKQRTS